VRITVLASVFPALSETFVLDQVTFLLDRGHDVRILADDARDEAGALDEATRCGLLARTRHLRLAPGGPPRLRALARAAARAPLGLAPALLAHARARRRGEAGRPLGIATLVAALGEAPRPDALVCHFGPNGSLAARALDALGWDLPLLTFFHGYDLTMLVQARGPRLYAHLFERGDAFLPVCDLFAERLLAMGAPSGRIRVQRMCVDPRRLDEIAGPARDEAGRAFTFASVGRLVPKKGAPAMLRAFARAFPAGGQDQVRLVVVGDGELRGELEATIQGSGLGSRVTLLGALPRADALREVRRADALVQASRTAPDGDMEGLPVAVAEAMALRRPVVATRHSGIPELVVHDETGLLADEGDEAGLADAMRRMAADRPAAARMGLAGRARLEAGFSAAAWNALFERRLHEAAARRSEGGRR
jgi:colanic acid/amylovoran biosynthesis glycosyltransferase